MTTRSAVIADIHRVSAHIPGVIIIHDAISLKAVYMSQRGLDILKITLKELDTIGTDYFYKYLNETDVNIYFPKYLDMLQRNNKEEVLTYFQQVRSREDDPWSWYLSATRILLQKNNKPALTITIAQPVSELANITNRLDRLMEEHNFLKQNLEKFSKLSGREKQVLQLLASGKSNEAISKELFISLHTAKTHRKKIKEKLDAPTTIALHQFASAFNLV